MSKCLKCNFDPNDLIRNEMMRESKVYNTAKDPSWIPERAVPIEKAIEIAERFKNPEHLWGEK